MMPMTRNRRHRGQARVLAVYISADTAEATYRASAAETRTATVPTSVRVGDAGIYTGPSPFGGSDDDFVSQPVKALGRSLVRVHGWDIEPAALLVPVVQDAMAAVNCAEPDHLDAVLLVYPAMWGERAVRALQQAVEQSGVDPERIVPYPSDGTDTVNAVADWSARQQESSSGGRRTVVIAGAVAAVVILCAGVLAIPALHSSDREDGAVDVPRRETDVERLAAFYDDNGGMDCRQLYSSVAVDTLRSAGLRMSVPTEKTGGRGEVTGDGKTACTVAYIGGELHGKGDKKADDTTLADLGFESASFQYPAFLKISTSISGPNTATKEIRHGDDAEYRGWSFRTRERSLSDGQTSIWREAGTEVPGHGFMTLQVPTGDNASYAADTGSSTEPDAALRNIIDGFEGDNLPKITGTAPTVTDSQGKYDCSVFYETATVDYLASAELWVPGAGDTTDLVSGQSGPTPTGQEDGAGHRVCMMQPNGKVSSLYQVQVTTGRSAGDVGNPVTGADELSGWEEYWDFDPKFGPQSVDNRGQQSYNVRTCRSAEDCLTVTVFYADPQGQAGVDGNLGVEGFGDFMENPVRPMALDIARVLDSLGTSPEQ